MKISLSSVSAFLLFMVWLDQAHLASVDYRYKRRGPPPPPRPPQMPQYMKKWENHRPPRGSSRPRPIPMQIIPDFLPPPSINLPIGPPVKIPIRPTPVPVRNYWKNTKPPIQVIPEKPYHSSPPISNIREYDYHIQTNNIPTHPITIKQLDEKGPIHTIPAPNLSLADKPIRVEEVRKEVKIKSQHSLPHPPQHSLQPSHQYQVTESSEVFIKNSPKQLYYPEVYLNPQSQSYEKVQQSTVGKSPQLDAYVNIQNQLDDSRLGNNEIYQIYHSQPQQQQSQYHHQQQQQQQYQQQQQHQQYQQQQLQQPQQIYDNYEVPLLAQALVQPQPQSQRELSFTEYQALIAQSQLLQGDPLYMSQIQHLLANQNGRDNNQVQFPIFTSERQAPNNYLGGDDQSTFITTDYNFKAEAADVSPAVVEKPNEHESSVPYVQEVFTINEDNAASHNNVEQNIKVSEDDVRPNEGVISSAFYSTLPNRQAAETLASLQEAGKINSNYNNFAQLQQQEGQTTKLDQRTPLEIYVPDNADNQESESQDKDNNSGDDDDGQEENISNDSQNKNDDNASKESDSKNKENSPKFQTHTRKPLAKRNRPKPS